MRASPELRRALCRLAVLILSRNILIESEHADYGTHHHDSRHEECVAHTDDVREDATCKWPDTRRENLNGLQCSDNLRDFLARRGLCDQRNRDAVESSKQ